MACVHTTPDEVTGAPPDDAPDPCAECGECPDCCHCSTCDGCDERACDPAWCRVCNQCDSCCECRECSRCDHRGDISICSACDRCDDCCECFQCRSCDEPDPDGGCGDCDRCTECECNCERDSDSSNLHINRSLHFFKASKLQHKRNPSSRCLGVEIEVAGYDADEEYRIANAARAWQCSIVEDGSLPDEGFELVTSPASGDLFCNQIEHLTSALARASAKVTGACGLHVHADARDFSFYDLRRLVLVYAAIEDALFATVPTSRRNSHYCAPCGEIYSNGLDGALDRKASKARVLANVYGRAFGNVDEPDYYDTSKMHKVIRKAPRGVKYDDARYHALNLHSWLVRGTVELRLHTGTVRADKIVPWAMLWASVLDYAMRTPEREVNRILLPTLAEKQAFLLETIAPTAEVRAYLRSRWERHSGPITGIAASIAA